MRPSLDDVMRNCLAITASCLTGLILGSTAARSEPASGWVDPPAKSGEAKPAPDGPKAAGPAKAEAAPEAVREPARAASRSSIRPSRGVAGRTEGRHGRTVRKEERRHLAAPSEIDTAASDPRFADRAGRARRLAGEYLDSVSAPNGAMLASAPRFYGERVRFHGRSMTIAALMAEKRRFVLRWPERRYAPQDGTTRTTCDAAGATCIVRTVMGFQAGNPARGARSEGLSELTLTVSFVEERPVIVSETSRVLRRGSVALGPAGHERGGGA